MQFRATREDIYAQVLKDTEEVLEDFPMDNPTLTVSPSIDEIMGALSKVLDEQLGEIESTTELYDTVVARLSVENSKDDWMSILPHWIRYMLKASYNYESSQIRTDFDRFSLKLQLSDGGELGVYINVGGWPSKDLFKLIGKPTRVLGKIFGEKAVTALCVKLPMKSRNLEIHFSKHYIPELYIMMSKDENTGSCMSKQSKTYGLPDHLHPMMALEGSKNAALALLWDNGKGRHIGRAVVALGLHCSELITFSSCYGSCGVYSLFSKMDMEEDDDMCGLELSLIEHDGEYLLPYVDGNTQRADIYGDSFIMSEDGEYEAEHSTGRAKSATFYCECCSDNCEGESHWTEDGQVCENCMDDYRYVDGEYLHINNLVYIPSTDDYVREGDAVYCDFVDEYYPDDMEMLELETSGGSTYTVARCNLDEAIESYNPVSIDGELLEQEEEAA